MDLRAVEEHIVDVIDHCDGAVAGACAVAAEERVYLVIGLEGVDHRDDDHHPEGRGQQRHGDAEKDPVRRRSVDAGRLIVLGVDFLQARQKQNDLKGEAVPNGKNGDGDNGQIGRRQPFLRCYAQKAEKIVDVAVIGVEQPAEHQSDGDGRGHIGQKINGLEHAPALAEGVDEQCRAKGQHNGDGHAHRHDDQGVPQRQTESRVLQHIGKGGKAKALAGIRQIHIALIEAHSQRLDDGIEHKHAQNGKRRQQIKISLCAETGVSQRILYPLTIPAAHCPASPYSRVPVASSKK